MANDQQTQDQTQDQKSEAPSETLGQKKKEMGQPDMTDGLKDKEPKDLTPEELRLMADTMPGDGPGD